MSRSYHVTRKAADRAMDEGEMGPTWEASEKAWVKDQIEENRKRAQASNGKTEVPNRVVVSKEKERTRNAVAKSAGALEESLESILARDEPIAGLLRK